MPPVMWSIRVLTTASRRLTEQRCAAIHTAGPRALSSFAVHCCAVTTTRKYELRKRAERQQETRHRIVEATVALHTEVGPARTSVSAIAERAGVQRHTVYSHFPDERQLVMACSGLHLEWRPLPDPEPL